ncbi:MAG: ribulose-phosphate 3-epimerase [Nanoarchaeota archaeon]
MKNKISPSILSADFGKLNQEIKEVEKYADSLHIDVMDGHFVSNISYGSVVVKDIKTKLPMDCHLMTEEPIKYAKDFSKHVNRIFFHAELFRNKNELLKAIKKIKSLKVKVGLAINPDKPVSLILSVMKEIDAVLIMSVYAGFGGQKFMPEVLKKVEILREKGFKKEIVIDGGINEKTIKLAKNSGANVFVVGSSIFGEKDRKKAIQKLNEALK